MTTARALREPFDYRLTGEFAGVDVGAMLVVPFGRRDVLGVVVEVADESTVDEARLLEPRRAIELGLPGELVHVARWIAAQYCTTLARALTLLLPPEAARRLSGRRRRVAKAPAQPPVGRLPAAPPALTREQEEVLEPLLGALARRRHHAALLCGVTGSGKTEVYLRAAAAALEEGRGAIVLVPEIALTPQIVARFQQRFGDTVAVLHSRMKPSERYGAWRRLREGGARVCVGPRSAVFAPVGDLGLIVVDEEHDASYKHESDPRYDAREVAALRARLADAVIVFGSATPRPESVARLDVLRLERRVDGRPLPAVEVLDMRGAPGALHPRTVEELAGVRDRRSKAIVLLNRRGWSNFLSCRSCGVVWRCAQCDVALVLHRSARTLECHHCGHARALPDSCPECGSGAIARHGAGTERVAHELGRLFGEGRFPVFRLDADAAGEDGHAAPLAAFERAECGLLVGTQMVAKGHDFADVELGVVLDADATLRFPDFRAEERTFALISQLAGRVGRGGDGLVLVQTMSPEARAIADAARHDGEGFRAGELERRRALSYPPFGHLIRVVCSAEDAGEARDAAVAIRAQLAGEEEATVLGPAPLFRLRGRERTMLLVKSGERARAAAAVGEAVARVAAERTHGAVNLAVDVEPQ